jgi:hypothetical protein
LTGGFELEALTFSGSVQTDPSLGITSTHEPEDGSRTAGNGGASVVAMTFSKCVGRKND